MLTQGEDVEAHALRERGWSISAIARHLGRDRKTVRAYLNGEREPGGRASSTPDPLGRSRPIRARFADDRHLWVTALFDEVVALGYDRSYPTFVRQLRQRQLRPHCEACRGVKGRDTIERVRGKVRDPDGLGPTRRTGANTKDLITGTSTQTCRSTNHD